MLRCFRRCILVLPKASLVLALAAPIFFSDAVFAAKEKLPQWVSEDCIKKNDNYYFVGYGEGQNSAAASRNALISSRQNALTCLFGGTITSSISIREDNETLNFDSRTDLELDYSFVNWAGYQQVSDRSHALNDGRTKVYIQYQWSSVAISSEKQRLDKMASQIAETKAKEQEIQVQSQVIRRQKRQLETLNRQAQELASLKTESEQAVARLAQIKKNRKQEQASIVSVISNLYCGITIDELSSVFRKPDEVTPRFEYYPKRFGEIFVSWGDYLVKISEREVDQLIPDFKHQHLEYYQSKEGPSATLKRLGPYKIRFIYADSGLTNKGYSLCE